MPRIARTIGYKIKTSGSANEINKSINKMLADVKGKGEENLLSVLAIRSMAKAIYSTDNIGHYGLGFQYYTHFTSPIRRFPDMMVHRLLERYLAGGRSVNVEKLEEQCKHSSSMEQLAANAERASIKYKQCEYLGDRLGEMYDGVVSVSPNGGCMSSLTRISARDLSRCVILPTTTMILTSAITAW